MIYDNGAVFIKLFGQGLGFTKKTDKELINTNQCRSFDSQCVDDPTDPTKKLAFYANNVFLPIHMQETNFLADPFCQYGDEL